MKAQFSILDLMFFRDGIANIPGAPTEWYDGRWDLHAKIRPNKAEQELGANKTVRELSEMMVERDVSIGDLRRLQTVMQRCEWSSLIGDFAPALRNKVDKLIDQAEAEELWRRRFPDKPLPGDDDENGS